MEADLSNTHYRVVPVNLRIILDRPRTAAFNMAADLFALRSCVSPPEAILRIYTWDPPAVSIGYGQTADKVLDLAALRHGGFDWIRRPTGGRAVLHCEDITYSIVFPRSLKQLGSTIGKTYEFFSACLRKGLTGSGITVEEHDSFEEFRAVRREHKLPCFLAPNRREIMVNGRKLVGSAQKRAADAVLQHGSIPVTTAYRSLPEFLNVQSGEALLYRDLLSKKSICLREIVPDIDEQQVVHSLAAAFDTVLSGNARYHEWSDREIKEIEALGRVMGDW